MTNVAYRIESRPTFRDLQGKFVRANDELFKARRDELRAEGRVLVQLVQGGIRRKVAPYSSDGLERGIRFNTQQRGGNVQLNVTAPSKARPHRIAARNANALAFNWPRVGMQVFVPKRGGFRTHVRNGSLFVGKGHVDHPGGSLKPLLEPILADAGEEWTRTRGRVVLRRISTRYTAELAK